MKKSPAKNDSIRFITVLAACNGEKWLGEQIESIIRQMSSRDRLLISLDPSADLSMAVLKEKAGRDQRIQVQNGPGKGVQANFEFLLNWARNLIDENRYPPEKTVICLSDQDDFWMKDKLNVLRREFEGVMVSAAVHNSVVTDEDLQPKSELTFFDEHGKRTGYLGNLAKNSFQGSAMAFRSSLLERILPFPEPIPMHDQWIGLNALKEGQVSWIDEPLMYYRRHGKNESSLTHSSLGQMLSWRFQIVKAMNERNREMRKKK